MFDMQSTSRRLKEIAEAEPSPELYRELDEALGSKYQGVANLAARALVGWIERARLARKLPPKAGRRGRRREDELVTGLPERPWLERLGRWAQELPPGWGQSLEMLDRRLSLVVRPVDAEWVLGLLAHHVDLAFTLRRLPMDVTVPRLKELASAGTSAWIRQRALYALERMDFTGKQEFVTDRRAVDPDPTEFWRPDLSRHDPRKDLGRRRRWT